MDAKRFPMSAEELDGSLRAIAGRARALFEAVDADQTRRLTFGFVATLAVADLTARPLKEVKEGRSSLLKRLQDEALEAAMQRARATATQRESAGRGFGGLVWDAIADALVAVMAERHLLPDRPAADDRVGAGSASETMFVGIDRCMRAYSEAAPDALEAAGLTGPVRMSDPSQLVNASSRKARSSAASDRITRGEAYARKAHRERIRGAGWGLLFILGGTALAVAVQFGWAELNGSGARSTAMNPALAAAFASIEQQCSAQEWPNETIRCQAVLDRRLQCALSEDGCAIVETYCVLSELGFALPNFNRAESEYGGEVPC